ncbi:MAG: carboxypeptidase-like regulatory domain-containing protein [Prevotella sp.]|jgi:hypothetical protein|nr:carboxypeptidase-like regulatory domain-containing protein [Prevotella sp.]
MKKIIICLFLVINASSLYSQKIEGKIYDDSTKLPIPEVSIYLNGTTYNTKTDINGKFELVFDNITNTSLIISRVGYKMISIPNPYEGIPEKIYLTPQSILNEIVVEAPPKSNVKKYSRKELLKMFKKEFLGETAKSCDIQNEKDIKLMYDYDYHQLIAQSENPIIILNKHLGYRIDYQIINFYIQYSDLPIWLSERPVLYSTNVGAALFTDLSNNNKKTTERRESVYRETRNFFFKSLINNTLEESAFKILTEGADEYISPTKIFNIKDTLSLKKVTLLTDSIPDTKVKKRTVAGLLGLLGESKDELEDILIASGKKIYGKIIIVNLLQPQKPKESMLAFLNDNFYVDRFGNYYFVDELGNVQYDNNLLVGGSMGRQKMGTILPLNYEP